jgi:hypothetical protein
MTSTPGTGPKTYLEDGNFKKGADDYQNATAAVSTCGIRPVTFSARRGQMPSKTDNFRIIAGAHSTLLVVSPPSLGGEEATEDPKSPSSSSGSPWRIPIWRMEEWR